MTKPPCQQIIDVVRRLKRSDPSTLTEEEIRERSSIIYREEEWKNRSSMYESPFGPLYYDTLGNPITMIEWSLACEIGDTCVCAENINGFLVSTVWLGLRHGLGSGGLNIFETMIFSEETKEAAFDDYMERYDTLEESKEGHKRACEMVRKNDLDQR